MGGKCKVMYRKISMPVWNVLIWTIIKQQKQKIKLQDIMAGGRHFLERR